jgi:hypothetical protein
LVSASNVIASVGCPWSALLINVMAGCSASVKGSFRERSSLYEAHELLYNILYQPDGKLHTTNLNSVSVTMRSLLGHDDIAVCIPTFGIRASVIQDTENGSMNSLRYIQGCVQLRQVEKALAIECSCRLSLRAAAPPILSACA